MGMVMITEVVGHLPQGEIEEMVVMMEMVVEMIHHHHQIKGNHDAVEVKETWVYVVQGPPGPPGKLGQDGRDGQDGQMP